MDRILRSWAGTPYKHCGVWKGRGVDCITFVAQAWLEYGILREVDYRYYPRGWHRLDEELLLGAVMEHVQAHIKPQYAVEEVPAQAWGTSLRRGDLLLLNACLSERTNHSALLLAEGREEAIIHCTTKAGVHVAQYNEGWKRKLRKAYRVYENGSG